MLIPIQTPKVLCTVHTAVHYISLSQLDTDSVEKFARATERLKFESYNGGRDSKERLAQGLMVALQNASPKSLVVVFTDNGSKDLMLENEIVRLRKSKDIEVFIVLTPAYEGRFNGPSLPAFSRMGKVTLNLSLAYIPGEYFVAGFPD